MIPDMGERRKAAEESMAKLVGSAKLIMAKRLAGGHRIGGGTGTYQITGNYPGVTEVQAGSYALWTPNTVKSAWISRRL
jgi:D-serine deaminase-like pyridoxal phosphate-dependent protein